MYRYKCIISYDGHNYMGFQIQEELPTVELEIKKALYKLLNLDIKIYPSGRTDRGVHAINQVIHFDLEKFIPEDGIKNGINAFLPPDIHFKKVELVDENFHARFSVKLKEYRYYINTGDYDPLRYNYEEYITNINYEIMSEAIKRFIGTHDFKGFASASIDKRKDTVKTITDAYINNYGGILEFVFIGTGFLKYQIRRMMGLLVEIGRGKESIEKIDLVLNSKDPSISHRSLDGKGLYLFDVTY
ncbi:MAG: tRNA pseudouridine(38-40) synthase TruA [Acholeplasmatales bacterium]|nr:tRNA pseudouridine(38-40) synthase TruA [Acholeplasmatales bacterium]